MFLHDYIFACEISVVRTPSLKVFSVYFLSLLGFKVLKTTDLVRIDKATEDKKVVLADFPFWASVDTVAMPTHIALSADEVTLSVCAEVNGDVEALMYDVRAFAQKVRW